MKQKKAIKKIAFTLAEVLITLGIIGVVAAITIPGLITTYNNKLTETRLKKFYSQFNQAIRLSIVDNEEPEGWTEYWDVSENVYDDQGNAIPQGERVDAAFSKYLEPYIKIWHKEKTTYGKNNVSITLYYMADGSAFAYRSYDTRDILYFPKNPKKCIIREDIYGTCAFAFVFYPINENPEWQYHLKQGLEPHLYEWDGNKKTLYRGMRYSCSEGEEGDYCTAIIKQNNWTVPKDYPKRIRY